MKKQIIKSLSVLIFVLFHFNFLLAQNAPGIEWEKSYGGSGNDGMTYIDKTSDHGFILAGISNSTDGDVTGNHADSLGNSTNDYWIVRLDSIGDIQWEKSYGGSGDDIAYFIQQTSDDGFIVAGESNSNDGDVSGHHPNPYGYVLSDYWILKLDDSGNIIWQKSFGGTWTDYAKCIRQTSDGGYVVVGTSQSTDGDITDHQGGPLTFNCWILKLDAAGGITWARSKGDYDIVDWGTSIIESNDGGYAFTDEIDFYSYKGRIGFIDSTGSTSNSYILLGDASFGYYPSSIELTNDNNYIVAASEQDYDNCEIIKADSADVKWIKSLGGSNVDNASGCRPTGDNHFLVAAATSSNDGDVTGNHGGSDMWVVDLDSAGNITWQKCLGGSSGEGAASVFETTDGGIIAGGSSSSADGDVTFNHGSGDYWIVKLSCNVSEVFYADADSDGYGDAMSTLVAPACSPPAGYVVDSTDCDDANPNINPAAIEITNNGIDDDCDGILDAIGIGLPAVKSKFSIFPNPVVNHLTIAMSTPLTENTAAIITILDVLGKQMLRQESSITQGKLNEEILLNEQFTAGLYLIRIKVGDAFFTQPLIVER